MKPRKRGENKRKIIPLPAVVLVVVAVGTFVAVTLVSLGGAWGDLPAYYTSDRTSFCCSSLLPVANALRSGSSPRRRLCHATTRQLCPSSASNTAFTSGARHDVPAVPVGSPVGHRHGQREQPHRGLSSQLFLMSPINRNRSRGDSDQKKHQQQQKQQKPQPNSTKPSRGQPPNQYILQQIVKVIQNIQSYPIRLYIRFQSLSLLAKRLVLLQMAFLMIACGTLTNTIMSFHSPPTPIEVSYSGFLDLIEQQQQLSGGGGGVSTNGAATGFLSAPFIDQIRIGPDRLIYRVYQQHYDGSNKQIFAGDGGGGGIRSTSSIDSTAGTSVATTTTTSSLPFPLSTKWQRFLKYQQRHNSNKKRHKKNSILSVQSRPYITAYTRKVSASPELIDTLRKHSIHFIAAPQSKSSVVKTTVSTIIFGFYLLILWRVYGTMNAARNGGGTEKDTPGKLAKVSDLPMANFDDIQGIDEAKLEVMELVDTIRFPDKYAVLGARAPTGLLLEGPPGCGKTMLARAVAASAGIPLLYCSGSDFVEMFVGRGAARIRNIFQRAQKLSPCIIFIDELDAVGKARDMSGSNGFLGYQRSNDEADQTLNQLLACMDGLDSSKRICVLAATNRKDVLDSALIRPGRFDRLVKLRLPDSIGREKILRVHCRKLPGFMEGTGVDPTRPGSLGKGPYVDLSAIATMTNGFSGADLEFVVNEAAIRAVRRVSTALYESGKMNGTSSSTTATTPPIIPHTDATDFEASLLNFFETRRPNSGNNLLKQMWRN